MLVINDSSFPIPGPAPRFDSLANGDVFRAREPAEYFQRMNANSAYRFADFTGVTFADSELVQPVSAELVISAP